EPEERAAQQRPLPHERGDGGEREQRRPEVEARVEERAEHERRDGEEKERRPDSLRARLARPQRRGEQREAAGSADPHEDRERGRVAPAHERGDVHRRERARRVLEREVPVGDTAVADQLRVLLVAAHVRQLPLLEPALQDVEREREEDRRAEPRRPGRAPAHSTTSNSSTIVGSSPIRSGTVPRSGSSSPTQTRPKRSDASFETQYAPSGSSGRCSRSSSSVVFESKRFQMRIRATTSYIRKTPNVVSGIGALRAAASPSARTRRVSSGSMIPSSQSRAVE